MDKICVVGLWHQGLVLAGCFAEMGYDVVGIDSEAVVTDIHMGKLPADELGLFEFLTLQYSRGRLYFTSNFSEGLRGAKFVFLSMDTPLTEDDSSKLNELYALAQYIGFYANHDFILCVTSQVPVGTTKLLSDEVKDFSTHSSNGVYSGRVVYIPEFLNLGNAVDSFFNADRIIIGIDDKDVEELEPAFSDLYSGIDAKIYFCTIKEAEMLKLTTNAYLATMISFINEISDICTPYNVDVSKIAYLLKTDKRVSEHAPLRVGIGYSGGTIARDVRNLIRMHEDKDLGAPTILNSIEDYNFLRPRIVKFTLAEKLHGLRDKTIGIIGLTYKRGTSTLRRAASIDIIKDLIKLGAKVKAYDPIAEEIEIPGMERCSHIEEMAKDCDAVVLITECDMREEYLRGMLSVMKGNVFFDTKNFMSPKFMEYLGFDYIGVGRWV